MTTRGILNRHFSEIYGAMSPPPDFDALSHAELKGLVVKQLEKMVELQRMVAALRDEIARLKGGPGPAEHQAERHGAGDRAEAAGELPASSADGGGSTRSKLSIHEERTRQSRRTTARLPLQRLHELRGAGFGDPPACRGFPLRALADPGRQHDDGAAAGRHRWSFRAGNCAASCSPNIIRGKSRCRDW